jgi:predicted N-formylglutamate amidohydrolase
VVEINQDQVADQAGVERWTGILAEVMDDILALEGLHRVQQY